MFISKTTIISANPAPGYRLKTLEIDGAVQTGSGPWERTLIADINVKAVFEKLAAGQYSVSIGDLTNGSITADPQYGVEGTTINLEITSNTGYGIKDGTLKYYNADNSDAAGVVITGTSFTLPAYNVTVKAEFETKTPEQLIAAGTDALVNKNFNEAINAFESAYQKDKTNPTAIVYSSLGKLASIATDQNVRKLMTDRLGFTGYPGTINRLITPDWMETYTNENLVSWYYDETNGKSYNWIDPEDEWDANFCKLYGLTKAGYYYGEYLGEEPLYKLVSASTEQKIGLLDNYYDEEHSAWVYWYDTWDPGKGTGYYYYSNESYVFVSNTQKSGPLDEYYDEDFGAWVEWIDSAPDKGSGWTKGYYWIQYTTYHLHSETPQYDSWTEKMPGLSTPDWFKKTGAYKDSLTSAGALQASQWPLLFYANLVEKNPKGLNDLLDGILLSVFGTAFEDAAGRFKDLPQGIEVDEKLLEAFGLSGLIEGDEIYIGKAELDLLFSAVRLFKASLEWVAAYDWNTDISFLRIDWDAIENISDLKPGNLPFGNNFMKNRNNGMMEKSKADFDKAITAAIASYDHLTGEDSELPGAYKDTMNEFKWVKDGLTKLQGAIKNGGNFYVPDSLPSGNTYDNTAGNARYGINMGKLFTPGQFAIDKLIETESDGKAPKFYSFDGGEPTAITSKAGFNTLTEYVGFKVKLDPVKQVVVKGLGEFISDDETVMVIPMFPAEIGKDLYGLYHK